MSTFTEDLFSAEQIEAAVEGLGEYDRYQVVAWLETGEGEVAPDVLEAFAKLARTLKLTVTVGYQRLNIRREKPYAQRRSTAIERLQSRAERGEITPANLKEDQAA